MSTQTTQGATMWKTLLQQKASTQVKWLVMVMVTIIIVAVIMYMYSKSTYISSHCDTLKDVYTDMGKVSSINIEPIFVRIRRDLSKGMFKAIGLQAKK